MALLPIEFPYVCADQDVCTREDFWNRAAHAWTSDIILPSFASRLQSWLFFGLISVYMAEEVPHDRLLKENPDGRAMIDFIGPNSLLQPFLENASSYFSKEKGGDDVPPRHLNVQNALAVAIRFMNNRVIPYLDAVDDGTFLDLWTSEPHATIFGVDLLIEVLCREVFSSQELSREFIWCFTCRFSLAAEVRAVCQSIHRSGRCQSLGGRLRPLSNKWHEILLLPPTETPHSHSDCTSLHCQRNNVDNSTYQTQHADSCPGCDFLEADPHTLIAAISNDAIPLVCCFLDANQTVRFRIVEGNLQFKYTAISHVWTGGLGNFKCNALPSCQIAKLWTIIKDLPNMPIMSLTNLAFRKNDDLSEKIVRGMESAWNTLNSQGNVYFWLDTLCMPVGEKVCSNVTPLTQSERPSSVPGAAPVAASQSLTVSSPKANATSWRQEAIDSMAQIYAGAEKVLVLDPEMQQLRDIESKDPTFMTHLTVSPWMARSWPLQEGGVAANLCIRLIDKTAILTESQKEKLLPASLQLKNCLYKTRLHQNPTYEAVWNALASRGTTHPSDLHGIFAALLNLSAGEILKLPEPQRMKAIISTQKSVPFAVMCLPNESLDGMSSEDSWTPSFPGPTSAMFSLDYFHGTLSIVKEGFLFKKSIDSYTFAILVSQKLALPDDFVIRAGDDGLQYRIHVEYTGSGSKKAKSRCTSLLMMTSMCRVSGTGCRGCRFEVLSEDDRGMTLKFRSTFRWETSPGDVPRNEVLEGHRVRKLNDPLYRVLIKEGKSNFHCMRVGPLPKVTSWHLKGRPF